MVNEAHREMRVNQCSLAAGFGCVLKNGDEIEMGQTILLFIDRGALQRQFRFELEVFPDVKGSGGQTVALNVDPLTIGRSRRADVRLNDPKVSSAHAQIAFRRGGFVVLPMSRSHTVMVNGIPLTLGKQRVLQPDDVIQLTDSTAMTFRRRTARS